jgi:hypothetical protein
MKTPVTMTALLFAATIGLQAQTTTTPSSQQTEEERRRNQQSNSATTSTPSSSASAQGHSSSAYGQSQADKNRQDQEKRDKEKQNQNANRYSQSSSSTSATSPSSSSTDTKSSSNQPSETQWNGQNSSTASTSTQGSQTNTAQTGSQSSTSSQTGMQSTTSSQTNVAMNTEVDAEVRTVVQQIDAQGPVVVERITTRFADATCTEENARALVEALHNGTSVTLRGDDGQTATFTPSARLGYGEAYIAMSLAVEALRQNGITGCASPAQWQAVLMGGQLSGGTVTTTSVSTERFPGILVLREQGGWTKVAQTTNVQLNTIVSQANTNLQLNNTSSTASTTSTTGQENLSPTGFSRDHDPRASDKAAKDKEKDKKDKMNHGEDNGLKKGHEEKATDSENPSKTPPKY